jgi:hypothetical protein
VSRRLVLIVPAVLVFLAIAFALARYLTTENAERDAVYALLQAQARGDVRGMLARLDGCDAGCRDQVARNARRLARPGEVRILAYDSATAYALGSASGPTRVAWTIVERQLPVVQCVQVRRTGSVLTGRTINLRRLSAPIDRQGSC